MSHFAYRIPPCPSYDIEGMESWLEDMAKRGLVLGQQGIVPGLVAFEKATPQTIRYRLIASPHKYNWKGGRFGYAPEPDEDTRQFHAEFGWEYVATRREFHIYAAKDPVSPEMDTDPEIQALGIQAVRKRLRTDLFLYTVLLVIYLYMAAVNFFEHILDGRNYFELYLFLTYVFLIFCPRVFTYLRYTRLFKKLRAGESLAHRSDYRRSAPWYYLSAAIQVVVIVSLFIIAFHPSGKLELMENMVDLDEYTQTIPFATMEEIFPEAELRSDPSWTTGITAWSTTASENIWLIEKYHITFPDGTQTTGSIGITYYDTTSDWVAGKLAEHLYEDLNDHSKPPQVIPLDGVDYAFAYETSLYEYVVFCKGEIMVWAGMNFYDASPLTVTEFAQALANSIR